MQRLTPFQWLIIVGCILLSLIFLLYYSTVPGLVQYGDDRPSVSLLYASSGSMGQLLNTKQIDAFLLSLIHI